MTDQEPLASADLSLANWIALIHRHLALGPCCETITHETRLWSNWDRVSLLLKHGSDVRVASISGVATIDPRSSTVQRLQDLARHNDGSKVLCSTPLEPVAACESYHERCEVAQVAVVPIAGQPAGKQQELLGFLICDLFASRGDRPARSLAEMSALAPQIGQALANSMQFEQVRSRTPFSTLWSANTPKFFLAFIVVSAFILTLCLVHTDLTIIGTGILRPKNQQDLFAVSDGLIESVHIATGDAVSAGDVLVSLRSPALDLKISELDGEMQTVRQQIGDLEKLRAGRGSTGANRESTNELAARGEELKSLEKSLASQLALLQTQAQELSLTSPIDGEVITADVEELLALDRPVRRTDRLLRIAELSGPWQLEMFVDQRDIGPVSEAGQNKTAEVSFVTADAPETAKTAIIEQFAPNVTSDPSRGVTLSVTAAVDRSEIPNIKPGTHVQYRIRCGRAALGYVWFRRLIDRLQAWYALHV